MPAKHSAYFKIDRRLMEELLPVGFFLSCVTDVLVHPGLREKVQYDVVHRALKLPNDCQITGVSMAYAFSQDMVAIRVEAPYLPEVVECCEMPQVDPQYLTVGSQCVFLGFKLPDGSTVGGMATNQTFYASGCGYTADPVVSLKEANENLEQCSCDALPETLTVTLSDADTRDCPLCCQSCGAPLKISSQYGCTKEVCQRKL